METAWQRRCHPARIRLGLLALNRASPKLSRSAPPNGHPAHLRGHGAFMGPFKGTLSEAGMMARPKAGPLRWRAPRDRHGGPELLANPVGSARPVLLNIQM